MGVFLIAVRSTLMKEKANGSHVGNWRSQCILESPGVSKNLISITQTSMPHGKNKLYLLSTLYKKMNI